MKWKNNWRPYKPSVSALKAKKQVALQNSFWADQHSCRPSPLRDPHGHRLVLPGHSQHSLALPGIQQALSNPSPKHLFPSRNRHLSHWSNSWSQTQGERNEEWKKKTTQAVVLTSSSWEGQVEKANFVLLVDSIYNPPFSVESALKWYCCAVLAKDCTCWPLRGQHSTRMILYKRFALNVMKQMTKSINLEWCGYHKNDVNSEFMLVMKLFRFIIKASTISFFRIKLPLDNHSWMLQEIFNKCIQN